MSNVTVTRKKNSHLEIRMNHLRTTISMEILCSNKSKEKNYNLASAQIPVKRSAARILNAIKKQTLAQYITIKICANHDRK